MKTCKYHPLQAASYLCPNCQSYTCRTCVDDSQGEPGCFTCRGELESQGAAYTAVPFWRRLSEAFRYPLNGNAVAAIGISMVLNLMGLLVPWLLIFSSAVLTKYCFCCLENTAHGKMQAPDVTEAYTGGLRLLFQLFVIMLVAIGAVFLAARFIGFGMAITVGIFALVALPASFMVLAIEEDLRQAVNPLKLLQLMFTIGGPYLILLALLMVMLGSVEALSYLVGERFSTVGAIAQMAISNYYSVVMFHLMGYVIFQYQRELGFVAEDESQEHQQKNRDQLFQAELDVLVKEGEYEKALELCHAASKAQPKNKLIADTFFKLIIALKAQQPLQLYADSYLQLLLNLQQDFRVSAVYKMIKQQLPDYLPERAALRYQLALTLSELGDFKNAALLLKNFHRDFSGDALIIKAYSLMVQVLAHLPNTQVQQQQYRAFVERLQAKAETAPAQPFASATVNTEPAASVPMESNNPDGNSIEFSY